MQDIESLQSIGDVAVIQSCLKKSRKGYIWDTSDQQLDSLVLIDDFEWLIEPTAVVTKQ